MLLVNVGLMGMVAPRRCHLVCQKGRSHTAADLEHRNSSVIATRFDTENGHAAPKAGARGARPQRHCECTTSGRHSVVREASTRLHTIRRHSHLPFFHPSFFSSRRGVVFREVRGRWWWWLDRGCSFLRRSVFLKPCRIVYSTYRTRTYAQQHTHTIHVLLDTSSMAWLVRWIEGPTFAHAHC